MTSNTKYRIMAIDPGSSRMGICIVDAYFPDNVCMVVYANTVPVDRLMHVHYPSLLSQKGAPFTKQRVIYDTVRHHLRNNDVDCVISEDAFYGGQAQAYASLTKSIFTAEMATYDHCSTMSYDKVPPSVVKTSIGVSGGSKNKDDIPEALLKLDDLVVDEFTFKLYDEHTYDAIMIAYHKYSQLIGWVD